MRGGIARPKTRDGRRYAAVAFRLEEEDQRNLGRIRATGIVKNNTDALRIALSLAASATHEQLATALVRRNRVEAV